MSYLTNLVIKNDNKIFYLINKNHCMLLDAFMKNITHFGSTTFNIILPIIFLLSNSLYLNKVGVALILCLTISQTVVQLIKRIVNRTRPYLSLKSSIAINPPKCQYSFPSGHTCAAFTTALVLGYFFPTYSMLFILLGIFVGISRIYLGAHYPTDVIFGALISYLVFFFSI